MVFHLPKSEKGKEKEIVPVEGEHSEPIGLCATAELQGSSEQGAESLSQRFRVSLVVKGNALVSQSDAISENLPANRPILELFRRVRSPSIVIRATVVEPHRHPMVEVSHQ